MFSAWVNTRFKNKKNDFWNQHLGTGIVVHKQILKAESGNRFGELVTEQIHLALINQDSIPVIEETWKI